jgi:hypothetical protein
VPAATSRIVARTRRPRALGPGLSWGFLFSRLPASQITHALD